MKANTKNKNQKTSAKKKLIPAVSMFTISAVMLSTATYAWFTMNKEVEVTGIKLAATTGDSLEISLGAVSVDSSTSAKTYSADAPGKEDVSWAHAIAIDDYYAAVGLLKPASTYSATSLKYVDTGLTAGGRVVDGDSTIKNATPATLTLDNEYSAESDDVNTKTFHTYADGYKISNTDTAGYYVDIPMWIRTNETVATGSNINIDCTVTITDPNKDNGSDLINAVRVAVIPCKAATTSLGFAETPSIPTTYAKSYIFGLDNVTYNQKVLNDTKDAGTKYSAATTAVETVNLAASELISNTNLDSDGETDNANTTPNTTVFTLESATKDDYSGEAFIVRIWIEGESYYCNDATANQDWQVDLHFNICDGTDTATSHGKTAATTLSSSSSNTTPENTAT